MDIVHRLKSAQTWLHSQQSTKWNQPTQDKVNRIVQGCVYLLGQSIRSYRGWVARDNHAKKIKGRYTSPPNNKALRDLVDLTISDIEACSAFKVYQSPWQLEEFGQDSICEVCGAEFTSVRPATCCSPRCRMRRSRCAKQEKGIPGPGAELCATGA